MKFKYNLAWSENQQRIMYCCINEAANHLFRKPIKEVKNLSVFSYKLSNSNTKSCRSSCKNICNVLVFLPRLFCPLGKVIHVFVWHFLAFLKIFKKFKEEDLHRAPLHLESYPGKDWPGSISS